ncbi:hypothetical protein EJB05_16805, partial [Eragrostis curvula]
MAEEAKHLETARADRSVWLMKCPTVVSRAWQEAASASASSSSAAAEAGGANPNPVVAKVVLSLDPLRDDQPLQASLLPISAPSSNSSLAADPWLGPFKMEMTQTDNGNTPKSYSLNMYNDFVPMCIFSESNQGWHHLTFHFLHDICIYFLFPSLSYFLIDNVEFSSVVKGCKALLVLSVSFLNVSFLNVGLNVGKLACEGKVEHKFDMKPHRENLAEYGKLCRERTSKFMTRTRQVQVLADDSGMRMRPMPGMVGLIPSSGPSKEKKKTIPAKPSDMKRTRRDRTEMENILFKLFEKQPNWSLKQLMQETDQPEQFLKEILNDLCVYNKRGPNQGTHELKPEYKKSTGDNDAT